jgi:predicted nucleic acid-binding protein
VTDARGKFATFLYENSHLLIGQQECGIIYGIILRVIATLDTSILVAGLRSANGASHQILRSGFEKGFRMAVSVALFLEYEEVLARPEHLQPGGLTRQDLDAFLDALAALCLQVSSIRYRWRPVLNDPDDDLVVECAAASQSHYLVTLNYRDFRPVQGKFSFQVLRPGDFLKILRR